jgi:hypothetical protein
MSETRVIDAFRMRYIEMRADLNAFELAFLEADFKDRSSEYVGAWCSAWWETRLGERILDGSERRLRGVQRLN